MKKTLLICLLAVSHSLFAQNIELSDLRQMYHTDNRDSIDLLILPKGYSVSTRTSPATPLRDNNWEYVSNPGQVTSHITKLESGKSLKYLYFETTDPFFYSYILNQLTAAKYTYRNSTTHKRATEICFANDQNELIRILLEPASELNLRNYRFIIQPADEPLK